MTTKGLTIEILRGKYDCTNHGITAREFGREELTLVGTIPLRADRNAPVQPLPRQSQIFAASDKAPAVAIHGNTPGSAHLVPVVANKAGDGWAAAPGWHMAGGHYAATSDSRFNEAVRAFLGVERFHAALSVHDRVE